MKSNVGPRQVATSLAVAGSILLMLVATPANGETPKHASTGKGENDSNALPDYRTPTVVVTGTKTEHSASDAPVPTQVVPRAVLEETSSDNIESVINQIPDIHVRRNDQFTLGASTVRMQGLGPNKAAIVIDGQRFRGGIDGVVDLRDIPVAGIEQIEIIRGPSSSLYGSDAMAGVINIRTRQGSEQPVVNLTVAGGTADKRLVTLTHGYRIGNLSYFVSAQHDAVAIGKLFGPISAQFEGGRDEDLQERNSVRARLDYRLEHHQFNLTTDFLREDNPLSFNDNLTTSAGWQWRPAPLWNLDASASFYRFTRQNDLPGFAEDVEFVRPSGELRVSRTIGALLAADHVLSFGARLDSQELESPAMVRGSNMEFTSPAIDADTFQYTVFVQDEILAGAKWSFVVGASFDDHNRFGLETSPRLTLTWDPYDSLRVSASVGRGFRAPDLLQLFDVDVNNVLVVDGRVTGYALIGNPDLQPETDWGYTMFAEYTASDAVGLTFNAFWHEVDDLIANNLACPTPTTCKDGFDNPLPDLIGPIFSFENVDAARTRGFDLNLKLVPPHDWLRREGPHALEINLGIGFLDTQNLSDIAGQRGKDLPFNPPLRFLPAVVYRQRILGTQIRVWGEFSERQFSDLAASDAGRIAPHWLWNFKLTQRLSALATAIGIKKHAWLDTVSVFVEGDNIFDQSVGFSGPRGRIAPNANFVFGLRFNTEMGSHHTTVGQQ